MPRLAAMIFVALVVVSPAWAVNPDEVLDDPVLEARAREISKNLRCLVCQNQSIDESDAGLAADLRVLVRERLTAGDSDDEVVAFVVDRYGDFVLLRPPFKPITYVLWLGPALLLGIAGIAGVRFARSTDIASPSPLSAEEMTQLKTLLEEDKR